MANVNTNEKIAVPAHVPPELVYDFDYESDPAFLADPHARLREIVSEAPPIFFTTENGGHWVISSYDATAETARTTDVFSSTQGMTNGETPPSLLPLMIDPPEHAKYRTPLNKAFGAGAMSDLSHDIRTLAKELVGAVKDKGGCEFISSIAEPMPVTVFLKLMGLPVERMGEFRDAVRATRSGEGVSAIMRIGGIMEPFIHARRDKPEKDLISSLWKLEIEGRPITIDEMRNYCILLFIAGLDTVINAMGFAVRHLAQDPELRVKLRENPALIPTAVEEMLRRYGIVMPPRRVIKDHVFRGIKMLEDDRVLMMLPAGNLDESNFPDPTNFDLERGVNSHLTFNAGPHRCVGANLARIELRIMYEEWLAAIPEFRLDPDKPARFHTGNIISMESLNVLF